MADNVLKILLESKSTLEVLGNLLQSALNTVIVAKTTGQEFKSIFDNVSGSGIQLIDATHAKLGGHTYTLKQLQHALVVVLAVASSGLIGYAAYKNPNHFEVIQQNLSEIKSNVNEKIRDFVNQLNIKEVINQLGQGLVGLLSQSSEIFDVLWKRVSGKIGNLIEKFSALRNNMQQQIDETNSDRNLQSLSSPDRYQETMMDPGLLSSTIETRKSPTQSTVRTPSRRLSAARSQLSSPFPTFSRKKTATKKVKSPRSKRLSRRSPRIELDEDFQTNPTPKRGEMNESNDSNDSNGLP
jgi:hypothetical protein